MGQQELRTVITIGGNVDNTFGRIGSALLGVGSMVDMLSQKVISFYTDSVEEYVNYDDLMREVEAVGEFSDAEMSVLDKLNTQIAQTTTYSNTQAAQAEVLLGQLGLTTQQIQTLMPDVLNLAMAGNLDLADSVDYLYSVLKGTDTDLEDSNILVDQMAKTAAIGATDIDTLGDSMERLGSGMQMFKGGAPEVMTLLSEISQFGEDMRGTQGGTMLRNFALSLIAPAGQTQEVIAALENYGMTEEDLQEYMDSEDIDLTSSAAVIEGLGLDVFDSTGNIRSMIDIISDLRTALSGKTDKEIDPILRQIFGKRGYVTAKNLLKVSDAEYDQTLSEILDSEGFAEDMKETMQGGWGGALRELEAAYAQFKTTIGDSLEPLGESVTDWLHGIVTDLSNMDEDTLNALVTAVGVVGAAGPALIGAGVFFRVLGYVMTSAGGVVLGLAALAAAMYAIEQFNDAKVADQFGNMSLNMEELNGYVSKLGDGFKAAHGEIDQYETALYTSITAYENASTALSGDLLTAALTGATLTDEQKTQIMGYGEEMYAQLQEGIYSSAAESMSFLQLLFGGEGGEEEALNNPDYKALIDATGDSMDGALAEATSLSQQLRDALTSAFDDGTVTTDEYAKIKDVIKAYNKAMADAAQEVADEEFRTGLETELYKMQTGSLADYETYTGNIADMRNTAIADAEAEFNTNRSTQKVALDEQVAAGKMTREEENRLLAAIDANKQQLIYGNQSVVDAGDAVIRAWGIAFDESGLGESFDTFGEYADKYMAGEITGETATKALQDLYGTSKYTNGYDEQHLFGAETTTDQMTELLNKVVTQYGGTDKLIETIDYLRSGGDTAGADKLSQLLTMYGLSTGFTGTNWLTTDFGGQAIDMEGVETYLQNLNGYTVENAKNALNPYNTNTDASKGTGEDLLTGYLKEQSGTYGQMDKVIAEILKAGGQDYADALKTTMSGTLYSGMDADAEREFYNVVDRLGETYDFNKILEGTNSALAQESSDFAKQYAAALLLSSDNPEQYRIQTGDTTQTAMDEAQAEMDASPLSLGVDLPDGGYVAAGFHAIAQAYLTQNPGTWTVNTVRQGTGVGTSGSTATSGGSGRSVMEQYAEGGYADVASIFGEAGGEWAIPEEHSERTAALLDAARAGSGFTWPELIDRNGGLNANPSNVPTQLVYAPVIHATDARDVEQKLIEDKDRFEKWYAERSRREEAEVYA